MDQGLVVDIITKGLGILLPEDLGTEHGVQAFHVRIRNDFGQIRDYVVASVADEACEKLAPSLRRHFLDAGVCFTTKSQEGFAEVFVPSGERGRYLTLEAAAAVEAVMRTCGWDESPSIRIHFVPSDQIVELSPSLRDGNGFVGP